ncbi:hypothetical protein ACWDZ8_43605, partial [Streptomyces sp. NPDC003233]
GRPVGGLAGAVGGRTADAAAATEAGRDAALLPDGTRRFLGGTCQRSYFLAGLQPEQGETAARFELRAVGELYNASTPVTVTHPW